MHDGEREGPADPEQIDEGFDEGQKTGPEDEEIGRFDTGQESRPEDHEPSTRFSEGQEGSLDAEDAAEGDFATGEHDHE